MTEFENVIIKPLITTGTIAFYKRHVDDIIVLAKPCDLDIILTQFNSFHPQMQFTIDQFSDNDIHFLDIQILPNCTTVYRKRTHRMISAFLQLYSMAKKDCLDMCTYSLSPHL